MDKINFEKIILREQVSSRGGGIEIDLTSLGFDGEKMTAYQNYLGGGMLGAVQNDCTLPDDQWKTNKKLVVISEQLKKYYHSLTNPDSEFESQTFEQNQEMPISVY